MRKTEAVALNDHDRQKINLALDQLETNLSDQIDLDVVEAKRYVGDGNPAFFNQGYVAEPVDETYNRFVEVYCEQNEEESCPIQIVQIKPGFALLVVALPV